MYGVYGSLYMYTCMSPGSLISETVPGICDAAICDACEALSPRVLLSKHTWYIREWKDIAFRKHVDAEERF